MEQWVELFVAALADLHGWTLCLRRRADWMPGMIAQGRCTALLLQVPQHHVCACRLRWVKSYGELALLRSSATIAAQSMQRCMELSHAGVHEGMLATVFEYGVKLAGASRLAYPVVAGGGPDACVIHYSRNDKQVHCRPLSTARFGDSLVLAAAKPVVC